MLDGSMSTVLVFGASGGLGSAIALHLEKEGDRVVRVTRAPKSAERVISLSNPDWAVSLAPGAVSGIVWAQGANAAGGILDDGPDQMRELFEANVMFIVETLRSLIDTGVLGEQSSLVIVSSVWQSLVRGNKLAYGTSKAALGGLVRSLMVDLSSLQIRVNAVLPGVIDSSMTRQFLAESQIEKIKRQTPGGSLASPDNVAAVCKWLLSADSAGVNGQFVRVDAGWSDVRDV
jgi:NAD(P)-dependent dehydrogenase (short-subunit alcohol dehydrogenase family)